MTIAKRVLSMIAALSMISNNSMVLDSLPTMLDAGEGLLSNNAAKNNFYAGGVRDDDTTDAEEHGEDTTSDEDTTGDEETTDAPPTRPDTPELKVEAEPVDNWVRELKGWSVTADEGAELFYKTSSDTFTPCADDLSEAKSFSKIEELPQGDNYVCFYARWHGSDKVVHCSEPIHYMLDREKPYDMKLTVKPGSPPAVVPEQPVTDNLSGVKEIYYTINYRVNKLDDLRVQGLVPVTTFAENGVADFSIPLYHGMENISIYVYAVDGCGNVRVNDIYINDTDVPQLAYCGAYNINGGKISTAVTQEYGSDELSAHPHTNYTYVSDSSYLKVQLNDSNRDRCKLCVFWGLAPWQKKEINISDLKVPDGIEPEPNVSYIPLSVLGLDDSANGNIYNLKIVAFDGTYHSSVVDAGSDLYYSKTDNNDAKATLSAVNDHLQKPYEPNSGLESSVDAYLFDKTENGNKLVIKLSDDVGIAKYSVRITRDSEEVYSDSKDLTAGREYPEKSEDGTVYYREPVKSINSEEIVLPKDGRYEADITISDIDGNINTYHYNCIVDTTPPKIKDNTYTTASELNYTTFGIYSKKELVLGITTEADLSGVKAADIKLHIVKDSGDEIVYDASEKDGGFVFDGVQPQMDCKPYITISDNVGNEVRYYFTTVDANNGGEPEEKLSLTDNGVRLIIDSNAPVFTVQAEGPEEKQNVFPDSNGKDAQFFGVSEENKLNFTFSDDKGLKGYNVVIKDEKGRTAAKYTLEKDHLKDGELVKADGKDAPISIPVDMPSGKYTIEAEVSDLAGNVSQKPENSIKGYPVFYVDKIAPVIKGVKYSVDKNTLNYKLFGIYGKDTISIAIEAQDNVNGCGVGGADLVWGRNTYHATIDGSTGKLVFNNVSPNNYGKPYIVVRDRLGNKNTYLFTANSPSDKVGELVIKSPENAEKWVMMMLENNPPFVDIIGAENYKYVDGNGKKWYDSEVDYKVVAYDKGSLRSGLKAVTVYDQLTNKPLHTKTEYNGVKFESGAYIENDPEYTFNAGQDGHYKLKAIAVDNAGNESFDTEEFYIDNKTPEITAFTLSNARENAPFVHQGSYGYFFETDVTARVYVRDPEVSSGIRAVTLYTNEVGGNEVIMNVDPTMLKQDENGVYAEFVIQKGFKGHIAAKVTDNVGHSSDTQTPDGTVIEDSQLHSEHSTITITPLGTAVNGFYNHPLTLDVTVKDSFSGIADIDWSIEKDNKSGQLRTSTEDMSLISTADVEQKVTATDANLITEVNFRLLVESDENDNNVNISMTDNAGNKLSTSAVYSLDLTAPAVSTSLGNTKSKNGMYYDEAQTVDFSILERNFSADDAKVLVNGEERKVTWSDGGGTGNNTAHTAKLELKEDGEYTVTVQYTDLAGNAGTYDAGQHFIIDKTKPVITNNFADFKTGTPDDVSGSTELYYNNEGDRKASFEVNVTEKNFDESDLNIKVYSKYPGSSHDEDNTDEEWLETMPEFNWTHDDKNSTHKLTFDLNEDSVYKIEIKPEDRAGNAGDIKEGSADRTDVFEVDTTAPVLGARSDGDYAELTDDNYNALAVYDLDRLEDEAPFVEFTDTNLYRLEYELTAFKPSYKDGREIGEIKPEESKSKAKYADYEDDKTLEIAKSDKALEQDRIKFTVPDFEDDGVYSVKMYAVDLAGNKSEISENTYVRILNTPLLAYIENSSKKDGTGWYSFEDDEYGPISKQPSSFEDLDIVMFSKTGSTPKLLLVDKDTEAETDTGATAVGEDIISNDDMYMVNARRYRLPGDYFTTNFTEDVDTRLYLRAENDGEHIDLGELYIDNTKPLCTTPDYLKNWGWLRGSGEQTISFTNISEVLDDKETVVYINGKEINANGESVEVDGKKVSAVYSVNDDKLTLTMPTGFYSVGAKLVDKAGNMYIINEVDHFEVGNTRIWLGVGGAAAIILTVGGITAVVRSRRRRKVN